MSKTTVHLINHTHWDREWFLTSIYTTEWIPGLIDRLEELVEANPDFRYLLDGQTLIIEDLLGIRPDYAEKIHKLVSNGNLLIGPYFCQPDWQLTGGETLVRNLAYGLEINAAFGGEPGIGWMVDTFGHISQSPQIHRHFGIDTVFVWRGVPQLKPYFNWEGTGQHQVFAINLFGGYRNLYGVTHAPTIAEIRLEKEAGRLIPYYPTADVPLFDGYDLEDNPEDPVSWFEGRGQIPANFDVIESTPAAFGQSIRPKLNGIPTINGELNSGKFGATFPGTFSSRSYLKLLGYDCEHLLYQVVEPLGVMAHTKGVPWNGETYKAWTKKILINAVHDATCGVSIDQVHEKMEYSYRELHSEMASEIDRLLPSVFQDFEAGRYLVSTSALPIEKWEVIEGELYHIQTDGMGVFEAPQAEPVHHSEKKVDSFQWKNAHFSASLRSNGTLVIDGATFGQIEIKSEQGDTYSDETGELIGVLEGDDQLTIHCKQDGYAVVSFQGRCEFQNGFVEAKVSYTFDPSPLVGFSVEIDSRGHNFHAELALKTGLGGDIWAGMPFDRVKRPAKDVDLMPRQVDGEMSKILMGQRELNRMRTFPMHDFVGRVDGEQSVFLFSKGNRSYRSWSNGEFAISLRRSVEWVTEGNLENRVGDAGPFFYVPDARCERAARHEMALYVGKLHPESDQFTQLLNSFQHSPLMVDVNPSQSAGSGRRDWDFMRSGQPIAAIWPDEDEIIGRVWHASGEKKGQIAVETLKTGAVSADQNGSTAALTLLNRPRVRIGYNQGMPDPKIINDLKEKIKMLEVAAAEARQAMDEAEGHDKLRKEHQVYVYERELHEFLLSVHLNEVKMEQNGALNYDYLYQPDPVIVDIGFQLNQLRIKRRIFDYVITAI